MQEQTSHPDSHPYHAEQVRLLEDIASLLRKQTQVPWSSLLWCAEDIGNYLHCSPRTAAEKYAPQPGFPTALRPGGGYPRWYAHEVVAWAEASRSRKTNRK